jgi:serine/threonine protein kinase
LFLKDTDPRKYQGSLSLSELDVLYQLATGLEFIHKMGLIHRDIKPENVLIWKDPKTKEVLLKWADFGLSKQVNERGTFTMSGIRGTYDWLAPEVLKLLDDEETSQFKTSGRGTVKSDVFVEGLVFGYYLLNGLHPFGYRVKIQSNIFENNPVNLPSKYVYIYIYLKLNCQFLKITTNKFLFTEIQLQYARILIGKMLNPDPANRLSSTEVIQELELIKVTRTLNNAVITIDADVSSKMKSLPIGK